nr:3'-5' exonuclease [Paracoccaceae bacterium]
RLANGPGLERNELRHSFRSSSAVLDVVDAVFSQTTGAGEATRHIAFHDAMPGRVDHWPLVPKPGDQDVPPWYDLSARTAAADASRDLAEKIAREIEALLDSGTIQKKKGAWRRIRPGDIMILVQRRSALFDQIISACKSRNLAIAGADRLKVGSELAVRDILAMLSFLALPEDDLSLAAALRSPLLGWSEQNLFDLAARRKDRAFLWQALRDRRADFPETFEKLTALRKEVDFLRPFELIDLILTKYEGRANLLQRLGAEAEDGVDELINQALIFEQTHIPSLTGFLAYAKASDIDVKREAESGNLIRVMTVHGAKGLESPIVILPDTTFARPRTGQDIREGPNGVPVLPQGKAKSPEVMLAMKANRQSAEDAERDRLLYVAMTRAERWLIVCGVAPSSSSNERLNWHQKVADGLATLETTQVEFPTGKGPRYTVGTWRETPETVDSLTDSAPRLPDLKDFGAAMLPRAPSVISPSKLEGDKVLSGEPGEASGGAKKGRQLHVLLEKLPGAMDPLLTARVLLSNGPDAAGEDEIVALVGEADVLFSRHPDVFGPDSLAEVDIVATVPSLGARISGAIDRLVVTDDRVLAVDFKTNARVPATPEATPTGLLRQMGAYLEGLEAIYQDRRIEVAILWTTTGTLMPLPHGIVRAALRSATTS